MTPRKYYSPMQRFWLEHSLKYTLLRIGLLVLALGIIPLFLFFAFSPRYQMDAFIDLLGYLFAGAVLLSFLCFLRTVANEKRVYFIISLVLFLQILTGWIYRNDPQVNLSLVSSTASAICFFWILNRVPGLLLALSITICVMCGFIFSTSSPPKSTEVYTPNLLLSVFNTYNYIPFFLLIFALIYFPRRLQLRRYFLPRFFLRNLNNEVDEKGFTLIELLVVFAVLGIFSVGVMEAWGKWMQVQKEVNDRVQIEEILTSQMNVLMAAETISAPSTDSHPLPIPVTEFQTKLRLEGNYQVQTTDTAGLVKITVSLSQPMIESVTRHYRLVGYRRVTP